MKANGETIRRSYKAPTAAAVADAALFFVEGQYLFHTRGEKGEETKYLSPAAIKQAFMLEAVDSGWLPCEAVRWGTCGRGSYIVSFFAPARRTLLIHSDDDLSETSLTVPLPGLVFVGLDQSWYIWAVRARKFSPDLELFHTPLPNIGQTGLICFGANQHPEVVRHGNQAAWELFISSAFNSHHADGKSLEYPQNILFRLHSLSTKKAARYPVRDLVSLRCTVNEAVRRLIER